MKIFRRALFVIAFLAVGFFTYRREYYSITCLDTVSEERRVRTLIYGIPIRSARNSLSDGYPEYYMQLSGRDYDGANRIKRRADMIRTSFMIVHTGGRMRPDCQMRVDLLALLYKLMEDGLIADSDAQAAFDEINRLFPIVDEAVPRSAQRMDAADDIRESFLLRRRITEQVSGGNGGQAR